MAEDERKDEEAEQKPEGEGEGAGEAGEDGLNPPKKKLGKKKLILLAAGGALLIIGGVVAALFLTGVIGGAHEDEATETLVKEEPAAQTAPVFYPLGDILVNLSGDGKKPNFLKIRVNLELASEADFAALDALKPRIVDHFQIYLRELRIEDLRGSAGLYRLREELLLRVTEVVRPIRVRDVLFQEMLVQ